MWKFVNNMELLLSRLTWPSVMVRERTAVALADLMSQEGPVSKQTQDATIAWIGHQNLESTAILGIIAFCRLADLYPNKLPRYDIVNRALRRPSLLSFELLRFLYGGHALKPDWAQYHSGEPSPNFKPPKFFVEFRNNFLPRIEFFCRYFGNGHLSGLSLFPLWDMNHRHGFLISEEDQQG